jgi:hypothetical protein
MDKDNTSTAAESELQKAIDDITAGASGAVDVGGAAETTDVAAALEAKLAAEAVQEAAAAPAADAAVSEAVAEATKAEYGDPDLGKVKSQALADLRPLLDKVEMIPAQKFNIYREIINLNSDKGAIEPAYETATQIADDKTRADALVYLVESIDKLGN